MENSLTLMKGWGKFALHICDSSIVACFFIELRPLNQLKQAL
jgi:hypothetical protein